MKKTLFFFSLIISLIFFCGCSEQKDCSDITATTFPVYEFTCSICDGSGLRVDLLIRDSVSCLHDYSLGVRQVRAAESAQVVICNGAGLEAFMSDVLTNLDSVDCSAGIQLLCDESHDGHGEDEHLHEEDPHFWLSPACAKIMAENICKELTAKYPEYESLFRSNTKLLIAELDKLENYGAKTLSDLKCRKIITFHDGFSYFADAFHLEILESIEEESGSEASAKELVELIQLVECNQLPAIFIEKNGSPSAASVISRETGANVYALDMAMSGTGYFDAMYHNINTIKEALG